MARIARRGLRIPGLPLFSLGKPWQSVCDAEGSLSLRFFEPRYVELARRVLPPAGEGKFGYAETYPPKAGSGGVLVQVEQFRWDPPNPRQDRTTAILITRAARRFRVLGVREDEVQAGESPLFVAHVQLLEDRDVARGPGAEGLDYWSRPTATGEPGRKRADLVKAGTTLVARMGAPVFESPESWQAVTSVPYGVAVVAAGPPRVVEGYLMVPIVPSGAVELTLFRELTADGEAEVPTEEELRAALLNFGKAPSSGAAPAGGSAAHGGRKSHGRRRG